MIDNNRLAEIMEIGLTLPIVVDSIKAKVSLEMIEGVIDDLAVDVLDLEPISAKFLSAFSEEMGEDLEVYLTLVEKAKPILLTLFENAEEQLTEKIVILDNTVEEVL